MHLCNKDFKLLPVVYDSTCFYPVVLSQLDSPGLVGACSLIQCYLFVGGGVTVVTSLIIQINLF